MKLIYPDFLWALSCISIPIIIHLFNFRKFKKVFFTNVRFLKEVKEETQSKSRIKHLLVLLCRIAALAMLVLAFAQPYIPMGKSGMVSDKNKIISVYIDNSFSMDARSNSDNLIEDAKRKAKKIAGIAKQSDRFQLLSNDFEGHHQRIISRDEFLQKIDEIKSSASVKSVSEVLSRQQEALFSPEAGEGEKISYLISDFQKSNTDILAIKSDSALQVHFIPLSPQKRNNLYIDSVWFDSPIVQQNIAQICHVKMVNDADQDIENQAVKLVINGIQKGLASISIKGRQSAESAISFTITETGWQSGEISITDYPVVFDDRYFFSFEVAKNLQVLSMNGEGESSNLNALFGKDAYFSFQNIPLGRIDYSSFSQFQLIILNEIPNISSGLAQELQKFVSNGGSILVFPSAKTDLNSYNSFLHALGANGLGALISSDDKISGLEFDHEIFRDVFEKEKLKKENMDLPLVKKHFAMESAGPNTREVLLSLQSGQAFLTKYESGKGKVYLFAVPLQSDYSNFARHAVFVPILYKMALLSKKTYPLSYALGKNEVIEYDQTTSGEKVFHLKREKSNFDIIPEHRVDNNGGKTILYLHDRILHAGPYSLTNGSAPLAIFSFNYNRKESALACYTIEEIEADIKKSGKLKMDALDLQGKEFKQAIMQISEGIRLWKWCILLALLFLAAEIALIRFWKK